MCPPLVTFACYVPFYLVAESVNTTLQNDNFYHPAAILTWPLYAIVTATILSVGASRIQLGWLLRGLCVAHGAAAIYYTEFLSSWFGLSSFARAGLDTWFGVQTHLTTPQLSVMMVPAAYLGVSGVVALWDAAMRRRSTNLNHQ
jgi:hypothetical protein